MADAATTLIQQAREAGIIDDRLARTILNLRAGAASSDLADAPEAVREAAERFGKFVLVEKLLRDLAAFICHGVSVDRFRRSARSARPCRKGSPRSDRR